MNQLAVMVNYLNQIKPYGVSQLFESINEYKKVLRTRSLVILISDFLIDIEEIKKTLYRLGKHEIKVIQVLDKVERELTLDGDYKLKDAETNEVMKTYVSRNLKNKYRNMMDEHISHIREACLKSGISFHQCTTDTPIFDAFYDILK